MSQITFRLPSKIPYGYVEVTGDPEDFGFRGVADAEAIGMIYASYMAAYVDGEKAGLAMATQPKVTANLPGKVAKPAKVPMTVDRDEPAVASPEAAAQRLDEGKKPRTVAEENAMVTELIKRELGATEIDEDAPPWEVPAVDAGPKPWENGGPAPKVAEIDW